MLFVGVEDDGTISSLAGRLNAHLDELGFEPAVERCAAPTPRLRESIDARPWINSLGPVDLGRRFRMTECVLYRSDNARPTEEYPSLTRLGFLPVSKKSLKPVPPGSPPREPSWASPPCIFLLYDSPMGAVIEPRSRRWHADLDAHNGQFPSGHERLQSAS
ncbi:MAG: hypothetical protein U0165_05010 [Polyangiaceae bacterium]